jgi:hypothetical protein
MQLAALHTSTAEGKHILPAHVPQKMQSDSIVSRILQQQLLPDSTILARYLACNKQRRIIIKNGKSTTQWLAVNLQPAGKQGNRPAQHSIA